MKRLWCLLFGHALTEWMRVTWVHDTFSYDVSDSVRESDVLTNSTNARQESRVCLRCNTYWQRWAP